MARLVRPDGESLRSSLAAQKASAARLPLASRRRVRTFGCGILRRRNSTAHITLLVDVTNAQEIDAALSQMLGPVASIDILVNNAGYLGDPLPVEQVSPENWQRVFDVNLTSVFLTSRKVIPTMKRTGWGRIVNLASVAGKEGFPHLSAYSSASAGVIAFTKSLGKELADTQIRVNCVAPAAIDTDMIRQFSPAAIEGIVAKDGLVTPWDR